MLVWGSPLYPPALYEPVNSIWQSICSETLLLEKHFRALSIDGHGAMNQNIFVVCSGERNRPFLETSLPNSQPRGSEKEMPSLDEWLSFELCSPCKFELFLYHKSWWIGSQLEVSANYFLIAVPSLLCFWSTFHVLKVRCSTVMAQFYVFLSFLPVTCPNLCGSGRFYDRLSVWHPVLWRLIRIIALQSSGGLPAGFAARCRHLPTSESSHIDRSRDGTNASVINYR